MKYLLPEERKVILLSSIGGALEFYDFLIFAYVASTIGKVFFSLASPTAAMIASLTVFAISYLVRPLGGVLLSHFGDTVGRKSIFLLSLMMMAMPTMLIGLLPGYATIGIYSPILLIMCRVLQGLAVGGEIPGAIVYSVEKVRKNRRGFACASIFAGLNIGMLLAQGVVGLLQHTLTEPQFISWGWRITFLLGGLLGIVGIILRKKLSESPEFLSNKNKSTLPIRTLLRGHKNKILQGVSIIAINAVFIYLLYIFMPTYLQQLTVWKGATTTINLLNFLNITIFTLMILTMGMLSDRLGAKKIFSFGTKGFILTAILGYLLISSGHVLGLALAMIIFSVFSAAITASAPYLLASLFPTEIRYTGVGTCYNIAYAIFGGTTPPITMTLLSKTHLAISPSFYLTAVALIALLGINQLRRSEGQAPTALLPANPCINHNNQVDT